jgi:hypothetical protein
LKFERRGRELAETKKVLLERCSRRRINGCKNGGISGRRDGWIEEKIQYRLQLKKMEQQQGRNNVGDQLDAKMMIFYIQLAQHVSGNSLPIFRSDRPYYFTACGPQPGNNFCAGNHKL